tara:strand:+ start:35 stop:1402 length:1368 start_codon:yes stop_codon:yes gene_type:complete
MIKKLFRYIIFITFTIIIVFTSFNYISGNGYFGFLLNFVHEDEVLKVKRILLPYKYINDQEKKIGELKHPYSKLELDFKNSNKNIEVAVMKDIKLNKNLILEKYNLINGFYFGINNIFPGSGYMDFHSNNFIILSSRGTIGYSNSFNNELFFKQIKNNINDFIGSDQFHKNRWFSVKDLLILENKILVSYTEEIKANCWNTSIIWAEMNYNELNFEKFFSPTNCIPKINSEGEFNAHQSGGRMINFDDNHILFSIGDYRNRFHAQDKQSVNGKIIKINTNNYKYDIFSMGHRNPQGLYFDRNKNFIIETEHGPKGGDEINIIHVDKFNNKEIQNFGWAIVSAGDHYGGKKKEGFEERYKKYPLHKSHKDYGFIEPLKSFVPSIGISEVTKIDQNEYVVSSLGGRAIYFFKINKNNQITNLEKIEVFERVRDLVYSNNNLYLFFEDTASIGIINIP